MPLYLFQTKFLHLKFQRCELPDDVTQKGWEKLWEENKNILQTPIEFLVSNFHPEASKFASPRTLNWNTKIGSNGRGEQGIYVLGMYI